MIALSTSGSDQQIAFFLQRIGDVTCLVGDGEDSPAAFNLALDAEAPKRGPVACLPGEMTVPSWPQVYALYFSR